MSSGDEDNIGKLFSFAGIIMSPRDVPAVFEGWDEVRRRLCTAGLFSGRYLLDYT